MGLFGGSTSGAQGGMQNALLQMIAAGQAQGQLTDQYGKAEKRFDTNYFDPYTSAGGDALSMYRNALGLGGPQGNQAAVGAFQTGPGYDFAQKQGIQALDRSAAGRGMFGSGNNAIALQEYGQGLANQEYGNWLSRLQGLGAQGLEGAQGQFQRQGALAGIDTGLGTNLANVITGAAKTGGEGIMEGQRADAAANAQGQSNLFSALLGGANLGAKAYYGPAAFAGGR